MSELETIWFQYALQRERLASSFLAEAHAAYQRARQSGEVDGAYIRVLDALKQDHDASLQRLAHVLEKHSGAKETGDALDYSSQT